ncbi:MAG: tetratricopeptide repeat protein [Candidatus Schekmanbacteria bacterium]|nr:tetratricopeptide repeat protein [Candidatus Schekmanbacteria bacterium]
MFFLNKQAAKKQKENPSPDPAKAQSADLEEIKKKLKQTGIDSNHYGLLFSAIKNKKEETEKSLRGMWFSRSVRKQFRQGNYSPAETFFCRQLTKRPIKAAHGAYYLGNIKFIELQIDRAKGFYQKAAELYPKNPIFLNEAGMTNHLLGRTQNAVEYFQQALAVIKKGSRKLNNPQGAATLNNLSVAYKTLGNLQQAKECASQTYEIYVKIFGEDHPGTIKAKKYMDSFNNINN